MHGCNLRFLSKCASLYTKDTSTKISFRPQNVTERPLENIDEQIFNRILLVLAY
jgi:hypothetical protein